MTKSFNRVHMTTATAGQGTITLTAAAGANVLTFAEAGAVDGDTINYVIEDGADFEIGVGTLGAGVTTLTRDTVHRSKIGAAVGAAKLNLSGNARVRSAENAGFFNDTVMQKGVASIDDLANVDIATDPPETGDGFVWDGEKYVPGPAGGGMFKGNLGTVGARAGDIFRINGQTLTADVTIAADENASAAGPLTVGAAVTLTVLGNLVVV